MINLIWIWGFPPPRFSPKYPGIILAAELFTVLHGGVHAAGLVPARVGSPASGTFVLPLIPAMLSGAATTPVAAPGVPLGAGGPPAPVGSPVSGSGSLPDPLGGPLGGA